MKLGVRVCAGWEKDEESGPVACGMAVAVGGFMPAPLPKVNPLVPSGIAGVGLATGTLALCKQVTETQPACGWDLQDGRQSTSAFQGVPGCRGRLALKIPYEDEGWRRPSS